MFSGFDLLYFFLLLLFVVCFKIVVEVIYFHFIFYFFFLQNEILTLFMTFHGEGSFINSFENIIIFMGIWLKGFIVAF